MISKKTKYALKALIFLGEEYAHKSPVLISRISEKEKIPKKFLELILLDLKNARILNSKMGKHGGYFLARPPEKISVGTVFRVLEGALAPVACLNKSAYQKCDECLDEDSCAIRSVMKDVSEATTKILDSTTLQDMLNRMQEGKNVLMYSI